MSALKKPLIRGHGAERRSLNVLVLGCSGTGKTLLLRHLKQKFTEHSPTGKGSPSALTNAVLKMDTQPTTGTDIQSIMYHNTHITFREVGSTLITKWPTYYDEAQVIMYCIDTANMVQIPSSWIELLNLLNHKALRDKSVLIVMNKNDLSDVTKVATLTSIMRMDDILHKSPCSTAVVNVSALTGMNFDSLLKQIIKLGAKVKGADP